ncbi:polysaccharide deacetylase family protein [Bacteroidetes bacterium endosymbiont of Geopemphigus sp.]|uniref:polysaccharide deacetylase family protein n=1 Tax=Bacteroidetes bacterium endosymbiont of Geopemphigus sp. TaxID=2047937 RepID=UPI000CD26412|nr:polysaccharide deacetylase family protein [Bacteroidetes bacterium endosymbiont of Geopemphigus sp.]
MLLIYIHKLTPRVQYIFKHIFGTVLKIDIEFTSNIETFIAHSEYKISYTYHPLGGELFFEAHPLLFEKGLRSDIDTHVWKEKETICFFKVNLEESAMKFDPFAASFYLISRYEEYLDFIPDSFGRFSATESMAYKNQFLHKPLVDIWTLEILGILKRNFPDLKNTNRKFEFLNVLSFSQTWSYKGKGLVRNIAGALHDIKGAHWEVLKERISTLLGITKDPMDTYDDIIYYHKKYRLKTFLFFLVADYDLYDKNISIRNRKFRELIKSIADYTKIGLYTSYASSIKSYLLAREKRRLEEILHYNITRSQQHFVGIHLPETYRNLVEIGIEEDYTMGFPDYTGFRAATCTPFFFYDLKNELITSLKVFPFVATSVSLKYYMKLNGEKALRKLLDLMHEVKTIGGTYICVMQNDALSDKIPKWKGWKMLYEQLLEEATKE